MTSNDVQPPPAKPASGNATSQLISLIRALLGSGRRRRLGLLVLGVIVVTLANAGGQVRLNIWQRDFYQAIEQRHLAEFTSQLLVFGVIAGGLLVLVVSQTWLQAMANVRLREWLTHDLLDEWLKSKRLYLLGLSGDVGDNPDQRIQQDAQHLTDLTTRLLVGLLQSTLLLASFIGVLWVLSGQVVFNFGNGPVHIPGYMVWCALTYSVLGSALGWRVGRPLVSLNAERYAREAELRSALVRINENSDGIVLEGGEEDERRLIDLPVTSVITQMHRLANGLAQLTWVTSGYGWLASVVPIIVAAPAYFGGQMTFGTLMMVVGAFNQVQSSLRWFVDNLPQIADWRATLQRVVDFRDALAALDTVGTGTGRIKITQSPDDRLELDDLHLALAETCATLDEKNVVINVGDRVQILGDSSSGKSTLFRALAGMWPWGTGAIKLPPREAMIFIPERPYLSVGSLRSVMAYPEDPEQIATEDIVAALERLDLGRLIDRLERTERWDRVLSLDERQRLALARLLLHRPEWVVLDDALSALDDEHHILFQSVMDRELAGTTLIRFGRAALVKDLWDQTFHIQASTDGPCLARARELGRAADSVRKDADVEINP